MSEEAGQSEAFVTDFTSCQSRVYAYIFTLTGDREQARDVLQEVNLVIWRKAEEFEPGTNFIAWAFQIARFQVMSHRQKLARDRLVFDDELITGMADIFSEDDPFDARREALASCLDRLTTNHRNLLRIRYADGLAVKDMATRLGKSANAVAKVLHRTRMALLDCIERQTSGGR
ncbi:MAG: sigma-70 family RNA polymerase sigma factor [Planctomycetota bacterium]